MSFRILDANFNRAAEGLRVVEEYLRFVLDDRHLAEQYKQLRHRLADLRAPLATQLLAGRDAAHDVGVGIDTPQELSRENPLHVARASQSRIEQALRCLEEYGKAIDPPIDRVAPLRYRIYELGQAWQRATEAVDRLQGRQLYVLLDGRGDYAQFERTAAAIVAGGADIIQLRDKQLADRELLRYGETLRRRCGDMCLFIMNDRPDLAVLCGADGVHVGQEELTVHQTRRVIAPHQLAGVSTHTMEDVRRAVEDTADYIGCGPVFPSKTKSFREFAGTEFLSQVAETTSTPAFAIGGITRQNVDEVLATGFRRIAVGQAVIAAQDPEKATKALKERLSAPQ